MFMLKKLAAAALMACLVPAAAFASESIPAKVQQTVKPVELRKNALMAQKLDVKQFKKAGDDASKSIKKDADKVNLGNNLQQVTDGKKTSSTTTSKSAVKPRPKAKQLSTPKAK